jgi:hypothetical protein
MLTVTLIDTQRQTIYAFLKTCAELYVSGEAKCRRFAESVM